MKETYGEVYDDLYHKHWWWRSRESILLKVIADLAPAERLQILDVGCGNGLFFDQLSRYGEVSGIEIDQSLIAEDNPYRERIYGQPLGDAMYAGQQYDLITALDVIEHIEDDSQALDEVLNMLRPGGVLIVTVPAFMVLWDHHDEINEHYRRYTTGSMHQLMKGRGQIVELRYLFHSIFFAKLAFCAVNRLRKRPATQHAIPASSVNRFMASLCSAEYRLLRFLRIPFGTSVLAVLRKPG